MKLLIGQHNERFLVIKVWTWKKDDDDHTNSDRDKSLEPTGGTDRKQHTSYQVQTQHLHEKPVQTSEETETRRGVTHREAICYR